MSEGRIYGRPVTEWCTPPVILRSRSVRTDQTEEGVVTSTPHAIASVHKPLDCSMTSMANFTQSSKWLPSSALGSTYMYSNSIPNQPKSQAVPKVDAEHNEANSASLSHGFTALRISASDNSALTKLTPTAKVAPLMEARKLTTKPVSLESQENIYSISRRPEKELKVSPKLSSLPLDPPHDSYSEDVLGTVDKWKILIETKDRILVQKDDLIKRQRQSLSYLKDQVKEWESRYHKLLSSKALMEGGSTLNAQLKELEHKNSSLKAEFSETLVAKNSEVNRLSKKLDELVYQHHKSTVEHSNREKWYSNEVESLTAQIRNKNASLEELERRLSETLSKNEQLNQHIGQLNGYLGDMPTMEEHQAILKEAHELRIKCDVITTKLADCEEQLKNSEALLKQKEEETNNLATEIIEFRCNLQQARSEIASLNQHDVSVQQEKQKLAVECQRLKRLLVESDSRCRHELHAMRDRHKQRFLEATSELRTRHKVAAKRAKALEMQLIKNSDAMAALNSELRVSQGTIGDLKSSIREVLSENQRLVEKNITLQEATSEEEKSAKSLSESQSSTMQLLNMELSRCIGDFESLVQLSSSFLEGYNPTTLVHSEVAGNPNNLYATGYGESEYTSDSDEQNLHRIHQLQAKVDQLREIVSDQFASQVCTNCQVQ